jgi:hypothetical protein
MSANGSRPRSGIRKQPSASTVKAVKSLLARGYGPPDLAVILKLRERQVRRLIEQCGRQP